MTKNEFWFTACSVCPVSSICEKKQSIDSCLIFKQAELTKEQK